MQGAEKVVFVRCSFVRSFVVRCRRAAAIKAIWTFSKFSLILLRKGFGGVTHRQLLDPKFGRFTSKFVDFLDQKWDPKMDSFRHARRATLPCGCNLVYYENQKEKCGFWKIILGKLLLQIIIVKKIILGKLLFE